jgi:hypothetical protein
VSLHFSRDDEALVGSVLHDLTESGLVFRSGSGANATYRAVTDEELGQMRSLTEEGTSELVWVLIYREGPLTHGELSLRCRLDASALEQTLQRLIDEGRVRRDQRDAEPVYSSSGFFVPLGQSVGWEAAVFDHYQAMVRTICRRLSENGAAARAATGSTYTFDVWPEHPLHDDVFALLEDFRRRASALLAQFEQHNARSGLPEGYTQVVAYAGQSCTPAALEEVGS